MGVSVRMIVSIKDTLLEWIDDKFAKSDDELRHDGTNEQRFHTSRVENLEGQTL